MKYKWFSAFLLIGLLWFIENCADKSTTQVSDLGTIKGTVYDAVNGTPVGKASVLTLPPTSAVTSDESGEYRIDNVEPGTFHVRASKVGFDSAGVDVAVTKGHTTIADIFLQSDSIKTP